jgi:hypothetical protein
MPIKFNPLPSVEELRDRFIYDKATGWLTYRENIYCYTYGGARKRLQQEEGSRAGWEKCSKDGYAQRFITIVKDSWLESRIIWKHQTGEDPSGVIDHINGDSLDNRWGNIWDTTNRINCAIDKIGYSYFFNGKKWYWRVRSLTGRAEYYSSEDDAIARVAELRACIDRKNPHA